MLLHKPRFLHKPRVLSGHLELRKAICFLLAIIVTVTLWNLPLESFGINDLTIIQRRVIAIFAFATILWITEAIPAWATSVSIISIFLLTVSDNSFVFFRNGIDTEELLSHKMLMSTFADPIIILFLGGFVLALAVTKTGIDAFLARTLLKPFGSKSENVLLGFILITGVFSMFISNTATAAMMLTFLTPVFKALPPEGKGRIALTLSIPIAANIGGMGTPIGTPPNTIALKYLNDPHGVNLNLGFGEWMMFMLPLTVVLLLIGWYLLKTFFPFKKKTIDLHIDGKLQHNWRTVVVFLTFGVTVLLWMLDKFTGVGANTVAMVPIAVFAITGVVRARDLQDINWSVIWMVAGGFALGDALNKSGLAENALESIPFDHWSPIIILFVSGIICYILSNFISNTATAALLMPILAVVCKGMGDNLDTIGGTPTVLISIAIAASVAMCLPISTPPNAIAHSTGLVNQDEMMKIGITVGIIGLLLGYVTLFLVTQMGLIG